MSLGERGRPPHDDILTPAEWRVIEFVRHGLTNPDIARRQGVTVDAVKFHVANALQKLNLSNRRELRKWDGVRRGSSLFARGTRKDINVRLGSIGQIARSVKDIAMARTWYHETLGLRHLYSFGNLAFFDCDGVRLMLSEGDGGPAESIIYFRVDDIRATHADLTRRNVEFISAPHLIHTHENGTEEWVAIFKDNEGRPLALAAQVPSLRPR